MKVFDARLGAVGLYSNRPPYSGCVRHRVDGILGDGLPRWLQAIDSLLDDAPARQALIEPVASGLIGPLFRTCRWCRYKLRMKQARFLAGVYRCDWCLFH